jgi:DNA-binding NarL/FixJ family response regulator
MSATSLPTKLPLPRLADARSAASTSVILVDDHNLVREGLRMALAAANIDVIGEASGSDDALELLDLVHPAVVILDVGLGMGDGVALLEVIKVRHPEVRVVVLSMHRDPETVRQALLAGADGYVAKGAYISDLIDAVRAVARGERYLHSSVTATVVGDSVQWLQHGSPVSAREREILTLLAAGHTTVSIANHLGISAHTVRRHVANLGSKLEVRGIPALVRYAIRHGFVREEL